MQLRKALVAVLALACADAGSRDLSSEFSETPFRYLRGVELGMTAKRLVSLRPAAKYAPYLGLQEQIPGYMVSYQFALASVTSNTEVPPTDQLEGVFISEPFETMEQAEATWREKVRAVSSRHRAPTSCESFPTGGMQARWFAGKRILAIGVFPPERLAPTVTHRVIYAISPSESMKQPAGGSKIACPTT